MKTRKAVAFLLVCLMAFIPVSQIFAQISVNIEYLSFDGSSATIYSTVASDAYQELNSGDTVTFRVYSDNGSGEVLLAEPTATVKEYTYSKADSLYFYDYSDATLIETPFDVDNTRQDAIRYTVYGKVYNQLDGSTEESFSQFLNPPVVSPGTASFDKNLTKQGNVTFNVTIRGGGSVTSIQNYFKGTTLVQGTDYTVSGNAFTIKKQYLAKLDFGTTVFTINTSSGLYSTLAVNVVDTTPSINGDTAEFNKDGGKQADIVKLLKLNGYTLSSISTDSYVLSKDADYVIGENVCIIRKSYMAKLPFGTFALAFNFSDGTVRTLTVKVSGTASSGDSKPTTTTSTPVPSVTQQPVGNTDTAKAVVEAPVLNSATKTASVSVAASALNKAFENVKADADGVKKVEIEVPKVEGAKAYQPQLPASNLTSTDVDKKLEIVTDLGTIVVPSNMIAAKDVAGATDVGLKIALADNSKLKEDVKAQIGDRPVIELNVIVNNNTISWSNPEAPVTVSIPYTPTAEELKNPDNIVVWYIDGSGKAVPVPTGKYDPVAKKVTFSTTHFSQYAIAYVKKTFNDITESYAKSKIEVIAAKGITSGTTETTYSPKANITRADFMVLLVNALGLTAKVDSNFSDVKSGAYYYNAVGIAKKLGIASGVGDNKFNPNASITREDMMTLTAKALKAAKKISGLAPVTELNSFEDALTVSDYAKPGVATLVKEGIIHGYQNKILPKGTATREEMAVVVYNIYKK